MEQFSEYLVNFVLPGLGSVLIMVLLGLARHYIELLKDTRLRQALLELVKAAEQMYGPGKGAAKRRYVIEQAQQRGLGAVRREDIEAAVYNLQKGRIGRV